MTNEAAPIPLERAAYPVWVEERLRFADTDMFGHVNHAAIVTLFEIGRAGMGGGSSARHLLPPGSVTAVRVLKVEYLSELRYPGEVAIGMRVGRIGRTSFAIEQLLLSDKRPVATASLVYVLADPATGTAVPIPDAYRAHLMELA